MLAWCIHRATVLRSWLSEPSLFCCSVENIHTSAVKRIIAILHQLWDCDKGRSQWPAQTYNMTGLGTSADCRPCLCSLANAIFVTGMRSFGFGGANSVTADPQPTIGARDPFHHLALYSGHVHTRVKLRIATYQRRPTGVRHSDDLQALSRHRLTVILPIGSSYRACMISAKCPVVTSPYKQQSFCLSRPAVMYTADRANTWRVAATRVLRGIAARNHR